MKEKGIKGMGILLHVSIGVSALYLITVLVLNFVPSIVGGIFFPKGVAYEPGTDRFSIIGAAIALVLSLAFYLMVLIKRKNGSIFRWYHTCLMVLFALFCVFIPVLMNMFSAIEAATFFTSGQISQNAYTYLNMLLRATTMARYLNIISVAMFVGAFCGSYKKN